MPSSKSWSGSASFPPLPPGALPQRPNVFPKASYRLAGEILPGGAALGWLLAQHRLTSYKSKPDTPIGPRVLLSAEPAKVDGQIRLAEATALVRDLVDTPAADLGPAELERAVRDWAGPAGAEVEVTKGDALQQGYPLIHAVGAAATAARAPRLIEARWGDPAHPKLAIVGKGVVFDTGGLDLKPAAGMRLMKKDMGGAAHALALARLIVAERWPVRLHLLIPAVENAVSGGAFRPGDILTSRNGLTVEIDNTDAEGRLILADALTRAGEAGAATIIDFATLTGAARIALGPDLPATFSNDDALAADLLAAGTEVARSAVAPAAVGRLRRHAEKRPCRPFQQRRLALCRDHHRRALPSPLRPRRHRLGPPRYLRLAPGTKARPAQGRRSARPARGPRRFVPPFPSHLTTVFQSKSASGATFRFLAG